MPLPRRKVIALLGGGAILAAGGIGFAVTRAPKTAPGPWQAAGSYADPRKNALSYALLAPSPRNIQPWLADLSTPDEVWVYADLDRPLPATDPQGRQITIALGCFAEAMRMAAAQDGLRAEITAFPEGASPLGLDRRPVARAVFTQDAAIAPDPLFAQMLARRSLQAPFDTARNLPADIVSQVAAMVPVTHDFGGSTSDQDVRFWRALTRDALRIEAEALHIREEIILLQIADQPDRAAAFAAANDAFAADLEARFAAADSAAGHLWLVSRGNLRADQFAAGADWLRLNLACTALGIGFHPLSQAIESYPEMAAPYAAAHANLAPDGGTIQLLARIGYGPGTDPSPRLPLDARLMGG